MEVLLQRHKAKYIYHVPEGLHELMSDISREVLRDNPKELYHYIADYLDALLITRENARVASKLAEAISEAAEIIVEFIQATGMNRTQAEKTASVIQKSFRSYLTTKSKGNIDKDNDIIVDSIMSELDIDENKAEEAAVIIQNAFKSFKLKKSEEKNLLGMVDWRVAARSAIQLYRKTGVSQQELKRVTALIKTAYKGYYTRRIVVPKMQKPDETSLSSDKKKVKLEYASVIPHVDFDVTCAKLVDSLGVDYASSMDDVIKLAADILDQIFDKATETDERKKSIMDETEAAIIIQDAYRKYKKQKLIKESIPECEDLEDKRSSGLHDTWPSGPDDTTPSQDTKIYEETSLYEQTIEPKETTKSKDTPEPKDTIKAKETTETEKTTKPKETIEPKETTELKDTTKPKESIQPKETTKPKETTEPKEATKPKEAIEPKETSQPKEATKLKETTEPKDTTKPEESIGPKDTTKPKDTIEPKETKKPKETFEYTFTEQIIITDDTITEEQGDVHTNLTRDESAAHIREFTELEETIEPDETVEPKETHFEYTFTTEQIIINGDTITTEKDGEIHTNDEPDVHIQRAFRKKEGVLTDIVDQEAFTSEITKDIEAAINLNLNH